ncbi:hypothetical protein TRIATDRAFT_271186 [Trichoderma atroviride IMI 206040]|uniref:Uncharacterized protein n=1 Tax=Hypocrea atroviridis (strain ATCC 20476 / IMI 206040) TaxID=452589 RepID=G9NJW0_HYPAI|nr:uncharacterized protein TRIATDRAFT_271186 [Trichoderma atroviride IMI 206040]EHK49182.1 hypothetical protein TRIATDRAFT_271186 [Trichoderma atroviride IMI 206040]
MPARQRLETAVSRRGAMLSDNDGLKSRHNVNGDGAGAKDGVASKQAAGSNRHGQEVLLPCKPSARMDKGLAHRPRLAGNLDTKEGNGWREDPRQWATGQAAQLTGVEMCNAGAGCQTWR